MSKKVDIKNLQIDIKEVGMMFSVEKEIDALGRIVLPKSMREYYGISLKDKLYLTPTEKGILITPKPPEDESRAE